MRRSRGFQALLTIALACALLFLTVPIVAIFVNTSPRQLISSLDDPVARDALRLSLETTVAALAIILLVPDTMEVTNYREGEPHSDWRREVGGLSWRPSPLWAAGLIALFVAVYANLLQITEFLYYQF